MSGLCNKCMKNAYTMMATACPECGRETNSAFKRCAKCAKAKNKCSFCDKELKKAVKTKKPEVTDKEKERLAICANCVKENWFTAKNIRSCRECNKQKTFACFKRCATCAKQKNKCPLCDNEYGESGAVKN